jgi:hypothetical protein
MQHQSTTGALAANETHLDATWRCLNMLLLDAEDELALVRDAVERRQLDVVYRGGPGPSDMQMTRLLRLQEMVERRRSRVEAISRLVSSHPALAYRRACGQPDRE